MEVATLNASLGRNVNFAAFVLSDYKVINALARLGQAGATIRIYLDPREVQRMQLHTDHPLVKLARTPNVQVKIKTPKGKLMHLKGYTIGGTLLRTGSANDSFDGLKQQDNDLILIYSREAATKFDAEFERMWSRADNDNLVLN